jgi:predicted GNAT superfamily acetyltransferase
VPTQQDIPRLLALRETRRRGGLARNQNAALTEIERRFQQIAEPAAAMATGMLAEPVSGIVGMAALPFGVDVAANAVRKTQQGLTYQPRTEAGQQGMQALQGFMQPIAETVSRQTDIASKVLAGNAGFDVNTPGGQFLTGMLPALAASAPGFTAARAIPGRRFEMGDIGAGGVGSRQRGAVGGVKATPPDAALQLDSLPGFKEGKWAAFNVGPARIEIMDIGEGVKIGSSKIKDETSRGRGFGVAAYEDLIAKAKSQGKKFIESDETVNMDAARVYDSLERKGYMVSKDPTAKIMNSRYGKNAEDFWSADGDKAPFIIELDEAADPKTAKGLMTRLKRKGINSSISEKSQSMVLNKIIVPDDARSSGLGTRAMQDLTDYADKSGKRIDLTPSSDFGGNKKRLTEFYKRFGFVENKGKNKDYEVSESMYRPASNLDINEPAAVKPAKPATSQRFTEDNRLSNLNMSGAAWGRIRENNPTLKSAKSPNDKVTIYRATIGDEIRPDDFVAVNRDIAEMELESVIDRDGAGKIITQQVAIKDLLIGNDASEFVYFPSSQ